MSNERADLDALQKSRARVYGEPKQNHTDIGKKWAGTLRPWAAHLAAGGDIPPHVVAQCMAEVKLSRMKRVFHADNYDDVSVYLRFAREWQESDYPDGPPGETA